MKSLLMCLALVACSVVALPNGILQVVDHPLSGTYCTEGETLGQCLEEIQEALGEVRDFISAEDTGIEQRPTSRTQPHAFPLACVLRLRHSRRQNKQGTDGEDRDGSKNDTTEAQRDSSPRPNRGRKNRTDAVRTPRPDVTHRLGATRNILQGLHRKVAQEEQLPSTVQRILGNLCRRLSAGNAEASSDAGDIVEPLASQSEGNTDVQEVGEPTDESDTDEGVPSTAARRRGGRRERPGGNRRGEGRQSRGDADASSRPVPIPTGSSNERGDNADGGRRRSPGRGSSDGPGGRRRGDGSRPPRPRPTGSSDEERGNNGRAGGRGHFVRPGRPQTETGGSEAPSSTGESAPELQGPAPWFFRFFQQG